MAAFALSRGFSILSRSSSSLLCPALRSNSSGLAGQSSRRALSQICAPRRSLSTSTTMQGLREEVGSRTDPQEEDEDSKLFVGNLAWATTDRSLGEAFETYGTVVDSRVIFDNMSGRSRGFGFVTFEKAESAAEALDGMEGQDVDGRAIRVARATRKTRYASNRDGPRDGPRDDVERDDY